MVAKVRARQCGAFGASGAAENFFIQSNLYYFHIYSNMIVFDVFRNFAGSVREIGCGKYFLYPCSDSGNGSASRMTRQHPSKPAKPRLTRLDAACEPVLQEVGASHDKMPFFAGEHTMSKYINLFTDFGFKKVLAKSRTKTC